MKNCDNLQNNDAKIREKKFHANKIENNNKENLNAEMKLIR